jgi:hypothetical protein
MRHPFGSSCRVTSEFDIAHKAAMPRAATSRENMGIDHKLRETRAGAVGRCFIVAVKLEPERERLSESGGKDAALVVALEPSAARPLTCPFPCFQFRLVESLSLPLVIEGRLLGAERISEELGVWSMAGSDSREDSKSSSADPEGRRFMGNINGVLCSGDAKRE